MTDLNTIDDKELKEIIFLATGLKPVSIKRSHRMFNMIFDGNTICSYTIDEIIKKLYKLYSEKEIVVTSKLNNIKANQNIKHMINGGICSFGKYNKRVFQGNNGNFYIEKDETDFEKGVETFTNLFCQLEIIK